jgi:hypothetical protein
MAKDKDVFSGLDFDKIISRVKDESGVVDAERKKTKHDTALVDILTFMNHKDYLRFPKCFYAGSEGNEDLKLTDSEVDWLKDWAENKDKEKQLIIETALRKHESGERINELVLVLGRRSGKTMISSIIATYEAYKCLELKNPQEYFNIASDNEIVILNIATAKTQAGYLYNEIKSRLRNSKYFVDKINQGASTSEYTYLLTECDKEINDKLEREGRMKELIKGSIIIQCGHSNSNSLMGSGVICLILDELAYFPEGTGASGGEKIYNDLEPSTKALRHPDGTSAARIVSISAPAGRSGIFYSNFKTSLIPEGNHMLSFQFPTWECSPVITEKKQLEAEFYKNEIEAQVRYGAEFSGSMASIFFPEDDLDECINHNLINNEKGYRYINYYMHVDPALTNHNYALAIIHEEYYLNKETKERTRAIIVDHVKFWEPKGGKEVQILNVEKYIMNLCRKFNIVSITFDDFQSASTIQKFRKKGLPIRKTSFRAKYKQLIYSELRDLVIGHNLHLLPNETLIGEFKNLQCKITSSGFKVYPNLDSEFPTDDLTDCVAGAAHVALDQGINELPLTTTFNTNTGAGGRMRSLYARMPETTYGR